VEKRKALGKSPSMYTPPFPVTVERRTKRMPRQPQLITARELANNLELSVETIWRYTREDKIPYVELGNRQYRYVLDEVLTSLSSKGRDSGMVVCEDEAPPYSTDRVYTYSDYLRLLHEGSCQYEILDGRLQRSPIPNTVHQRVLAKLLHVLQNYFWDMDPLGEVLAAPLTLILSDTNVIQPDLVYIPGEIDIIEDQSINGVPELIVEILSPATVGTDRINKTRIYNRFGVPHYWMVDPEGQIMQAYALLPSGEYAISSSVGGDEVFTQSDFPELTVELRALWKRGSLSVK
jgi:Uma2 family endonuclease/predicted DNA-binding transcriptional regulator AlpA